MFHCRVSKVRKDFLRADYTCKGLKGHGCEKEVYGCEGKLWEPRTAEMNKELREIAFKALYPDREHDHVRFFPMWLGIQKAKTSEDDSKKWRYRDLTLPQYFNW